MLQKSLKRIRKSFAPYKGGPSIKSMRMVGACSAHGRRHGAYSFIPEGKPCGLGLRPDHVRWPDLRAGFSCGFRATKNSALGFGFFGFFLTQMASEARCRFDSDA